MSQAPDPFEFDRLHADIASLRDKQIFFIGGAPKSGTTWLQMLLNTHPQISCLGEGHFPSHFASHLVGALNTYNQHVQGRNEALFAGFSGYPLMGESQYLYLLGAGIRLSLLQPEKSRTAVALGEKTPDNVLSFDLLHRLFPRARFIHMVRDGRDCAVSGWFHRQRVNPGELAGEFNSMQDFIGRAADSWVRLVKAGHDFAAAHPDLTIALRYRDLQNDGPNTLSAAFRFLGVSVTPQVVQHCLQSVAFEKLSGGRQPGQEDRSSFFRQGCADNWRQHFTGDMDAVFQERAGEWLKRFGFS